MLPAALRRRLGMGAGARIEVLEEPDGLKLRVVRSVATAAVAALAERCFVSVTVLLELEWVMRGFYELPVRDISRVLRALASIEHVTLEDRDAVLTAIDALDKGMDFADALHLARSSHASAFATLDRQLAKRAKSLAQVPPVELLA